MNKLDWNATKDAMPIGSSVDVVVAQRMPFGLLVTVDDSVSGVLERIQMERVGYKTPDDYPAVGDTIKCIVLGFRDWSEQIEVGLEPKALNETLIEVGLRLGETRELEFFGLDEVNHAIRCGKAVRAVEKGRALMTKVNEGDDVRVRFEGFSILIALEDDLNAAITDVSEGER